MKINTALEFLLEMVKFNNEKMPEYFFIYIDLALQMEREQIMTAWENGSLPGMFKEYKSSRNYFENTYQKYSNNKNAGNNSASMV
jgi:hypothetical protein